MLFITFKVTKELHSDAAYGSSRNDKEFSKHNINHIKTGVKGSKCMHSILRTANSTTTSLTSKTEYIVSCPEQRVGSEKTPKRFKASFDLNICNKCFLASECSTQKMKNHRVYYFTYETYLLSERLSRIKEIPKERRFLRNNVEATVKEFTCRMPNKKLKVRGAFRASLFAFSTAMAINYGRIYRAMAIYEIISFVFAMKFTNYLGKYLFRLSINFRRSCVRNIGENNILFSRCT